MIPPSLNWDEVSLGYNAYSVLKTGKDEWGQPLPLSFRAYGDYKLPGYIYFDLPFIAILGLNEWGVRIPSALLGVGTVIFIYLILKKLTEKVEIALWGMLFAGITPWLIILSRIALEAQLALFLTTGAVYFFFLGLQKKLYIFISLTFFGLTLFSYNSSRVVTPLLVLLVLIFYSSQLRNKWTVMGLLIFLVFFAVALPAALAQDSSARYRWTAIIDEGAVSKINELRGSSAMPPAVERLTYNKVTYFVPEVLKNYLSHFHPNFLFLNGGSNFQFSIPGSGLLYPLTAPFLLLGLWQIYRERQKWQLLILGWLLIAVIPAAITRDSPHALRSLMMVPPLVIIMALGASYLTKQKLLSTILVIVLFLSLYLFWKNYIGSYVKNYSWSWQYGYEEVLDYIKKNGDQYQKIYFTKKYGEAHEFVLFYLRIDPQKYFSDPNLVRYKKSDWFWVDRFDKFEFINDWEVVEKVKSQKSKVKGLLVTSPGNYPSGSQLLKTINFLDGQPAFDILEYKSNQ